MSLVLAGDGRTWRITAKFSLSDVDGLLFLIDGAGWSQWLKLRRKTDTRGRNRWFFEDGSETYQKAYFANGRFASRRAHGLSYHGESLSRSQRHWEKIAEEEMSLRAAVDRNTASGSEVERLMEIERYWEDAMASFALKLEQPRVNKRARRRRFEQEVEDAKRRLYEREQGAEPLDVSALSASIAEVRDAAPPLQDVGDWRPKTDHGFVDYKAPHLNIAVLMRLGLFVEGQRTATHLGWGPDWNSEPGRRIYFIADLTTATQPFALLIHRRPGAIKAQIFWIPELRGDFNKPTRRFVEPYTRTTSKILVLQGDVFVVRNFVPGGDSST